MEKTTRLNRQIVTLFLGILTLSTTLGCQTLDDFKLSKEWQDRLSLERDTIADKTPVKMVTLWADEVYYSAGKTATRGFGGRIYFYNRKNEAIEVEGSFTVYGFDANQPDSDTPERKFVFTGEQFANYEKESTLGPSYNIWLPWDAVGGEQKSVDLVPFFIEKKGKVLVGDQASHLLPGSKSGTKDKPRTPSPVQQTVHQTTSTRAQKPRMQTTTIAVSPQTSQRMQIDAPTQDKKATTIREPAKMSLREQFHRHQRKKQTEQHRTTPQPPANAEEAAAYQVVPATYQASNRFGRSRYQVPRGPNGQPIGERVQSPQPPATLPWNPASSAQMPPASSAGSWQFVPAAAQ